MISFVKPCVSDSSHGLAYLLRTYRLSGSFSTRLSGTGGIGAFCPGLGELNDTEAETIYIYIYIHAYMKIAQRLISF